ncbi:ABC transporter permease [Ornithinibacillus sp. 4-3]|uniref:ABC transporter permease n=1 Tax=Ornithinibacillus sp. 4-3 TaxID=3231488 RepID=A0AB39HNE8_9BACI
MQGDIVANSLTRKKSFFSRTLLFWKRFSKRKVSVFGLVIILIFIIMSLFGPFLTSHDPLEQNLINNFEKSSSDHWLGTDNLGRDVLSRLIFGAKISFQISIVSVGLGLLGGLILGGVAGYYGGRIDALIMRFIDILLAFPGILLAIAIVAILGNGIFNTMLAVAIFTIPDFARIFRGSVISIKEMEYIDASKAMGFPDRTIILKHILPNSLSPLIVQGTQLMGTSILIASGLSFIGLGVQPPNPEWGAMLSDAREYLNTFPLLAIAPGTAITLVVLSFSLVGDGLRDVLDPQLKNR